MDVFEAIRKRRTIRKFKDEKVPFSALERCVEAARLAPSAMNLQPLEYIVVDDEELLPQVFECTQWASSLPEAGPKEGEEPRAYIAVLVRKEDSSLFERVDAGLAVENILLTALEKGLASCCLGAIDRGKLKKLLGVPDKFELPLLVALGYPKQRSVAYDSSEKTSYHLVGETLHVPKRPLEEVLHGNKY